MTDKWMRWALRRAGLWSLFMVVQYCIVAGLAWRWVLGLSFPLWKLLIVAVIQAFIAWVSSAIWPRAPKGKKK